MNYKYEFERLLEIAEQVINVVDFDNRKIKTFAELRVLKNAIDFYEDHLNQVEDGQAESTRCKKCFQVHHPKDYCYRVLSNTPEG